MVLDGTRMGSRTGSGAWILLGCGPGAGCGSTYVVLGFGLNLNLLSAMLTHLVGQA
jgi:hypothetical protein